jgi:hypothetical protein
MKPASQNKENDMTTNKKQPAFEVFTVREGTKGRKSYFTKIGTVWPAKTGKGFVQYLDALPIDGKLILMPPKAKEEPAPDAVPDDNGPYIDDADHFNIPT